MTDLYKTTLSQVETEFMPFLDLLHAEKVTRFLEIGSRFGGSLWRIAHMLPYGSLVVSVDSGKGQGGNKPGQRESLVACIDQLNREGFDAHLFMGHSQKQAIVDQVRKLSPFDCVFIDGDHRAPGVTQDWKNYGPMARMVAFHDIACEQNDPSAPPVEVPIVWNELKQGRRHAEFIDKQNGNMGIGVLWR